MDSDNPKPPRCFDSCQSSDFSDTRRDVAVLDTRLKSLESRVDELRKATETGIDDLHTDMNNFHSKQAATTGQLVGTVDRLVAQNAEISKLLIIGNGSASVMNRLSNVEFEAKAANDGLRQHEAKCNDRSKGWQAFGVNLMQIIGGIVAAAIGGAVGYFVK